MFKGETLRGLLLTSYGFSEFGAKAAQAATVAYLAAGLMLLLAIARLHPRTGHPQDQGLRGAGAGHHPRPGRRVTRTCPDPQPDEGPRTGGAPRLACSGFRMGSEEGPRQPVESGPDGSPYKLHEQPPG